MISIFSYLGPKLTTLSWAHFTLSWAQVNGLVILGSSQQLILGVLNKVKIMEIANLGPKISLGFLLQTVCHTLQIYETVVPKNVYPLCHGASFYPLLLV